MLVLAVHSFTSLVFAACECANLQTNLYLSLCSARCNIEVYSSTCEQDATVNEISAGCYDPKNC